MNGPDARKVLTVALEIADGNELDFGKEVVNITELRLVHVMHGVDELGIYDSA